MKTKLCVLLALSLMSALSYSGQEKGGGDQLAAHFAEVTKRALRAVQLLCSDEETSDRAACSLLPRLQDSISNMKVVPRPRNSVIGPDGYPRDAGNDASEGGRTVFLDIDRWSDQLKLTEPKSIEQARYGQVTLALHEPLVLAGLEENDGYRISSTLTAMIKKNHFDFGAIVGNLNIKISPMIQKFTATVTNGSHHACYKAIDAARMKALEAGFDPHDCTFPQYCNNTAYYFFEKTEAVVVCRKNVIEHNRND